ncbi:MAG: hypothetical protein JKY34_11900, partial [Kordiimonadaceae bacterium]|nr:hypothetical protein [Kordiimonadaceae bacterium]
EGRGENAIGNTTKRFLTDIQTDLVDVMTTQSPSYRAARDEFRRTSPLVDEIVITTGIVTAVDDNGFFLQDATGDGNTDTSDGIFVFTNSTPTVVIGDEAEVVGTVQEFGFSGGLTVTQIDAASVVINSSGNSVPDAVIIGAGGVLPPSEAIFTPAAGSTSAIDLANAVDAAADTFDPAQDGIDFYESLEGMLVTVQDAISVSPASRFNEIYVVADQGAGSTGFNERGGISVSEGDLNPEKIQIQINSDIGPDIDTSTIATGDVIGDVTGVVHYSFGNYEVLARDIAQPVAGGLQAEITDLVGGENQLTVASFNVLNLDPSDTVQIAALAVQIVTNLKNPDIIGLQEVQDNNGSGSGIVASDETLQALVDAIVLAGGPSYSFAVVDPVGENTQGGQPNGNIRVAFLYNDERVDLVEGSVQALDEATLIAAGVVESDGFNGSRIPLEAQFVFNGETVTIINNHFSSKSGSASLFGNNQPAEEGGAGSRESQATALNEYVDSLLATDSDANIVVVGDFNDFDFSTPLDIIEGGSGSDQILFNQIENIAISEDRYTFNFQGNSQAIDQFLVTGNLASVTEIDIVHVNADFPNPASDHDPVLGRITLGDTLPTDPIHLSGTNQDDTLTGGNADDVIWGRAGADTITLYAGNDIAGGSSGNDFISAGSGDDKIYGGSGADTLDGADGADKLYGGSGADSITGGAGDDKIYGSSGADIIDGGDGNDYIYGGTHADTISGGDGDDIISASTGSDVVTAGEGADTVYGSTGTDNIQGDGGNDLLFGGTNKDTVDGGSGDDTVYGGSNDDIIIGGTGDDLLDGGSGDDTFVFAAGSGADTIADFNTNKDTLDLANTITDFTDIASVQAAATETVVSGTSGVLIDLGGDSVFLEGLSLDDIADADYIF